MAVYSNNLYVAFSYSQADPIKSAAIWRCHVATDLIGYWSHPTIWITRVLAAQSH